MTLNEFTKKNVNIEYEIKDDKVYLRVQAFDKEELNIVKDMNFFHNEEDITDWVFQEIYDMGLPQEYYKNIRT